MAASYPATCLKHAIHEASGQPYCIQYQTVPTASSAAMEIIGGIVNFFASPTGWAALAVVGTLVVVFCGSKILGWLQNKFYQFISLFDSGKPREMVVVDTSGRPVDWQYLYSRAGHGGNGGGQPPPILSAGEPDGSSAIDPNQQRYLRR